MSPFKNIFFLALIFCPLRGYSFPEMVRHHYINCGACHMANSGGGLLNAYGRTISSELLSTWGGLREARPFYALDIDKPDSWFNLGGDIRGLQYHEENDKIRRGRYFWMEGNIQAAATFQKVTAFVSYGQVDTQAQTLKLIAAKYFVSYQATDELSFRAGRYVPIYGLNIPEHNFLIRQNLALAPGAERDAADIQWNGENFGWAAGVSKSLVDSLVADEENALNLQLQYSFLDKHKVGVSYWYGEALNYKKIMLGTHAILGWTEKFYTLAEVDHVWNKDNLDVETKSIYQLLKVGYEIFKGFHLQAVEEWGKPNTDQSAEFQNLGVGAIWYPRPHFEFEGLWSKRQLPGATSTEDYAYLLTHFYF